MGRTSNHKAWSRSFLHVARSTFPDLTSLAIRPSRSEFFGGYNAVDILRSESRILPNKAKHPTVNRSMWVDFLELRSRLAFWGFTRGGCSLRSAIIRMKIHDIPSRSYREIYSICDSFRWSHLVLYHIDCWRLMGLVTFASRNTNSHCVVPLYIAFGRIEAGLPIHSLYVGVFTLLNGPTYHRKDSPLAMFHLSSVSGSFALTYRITILLGHVSDTHRCYNESKRIMWPNKSLHPTVNRSQSRAILQLNHLWFASVLHAAADFYVRQE